MGNVHVFCFLASYCSAFALECARLRARGGWIRPLMLLFGVAGMTAHTLYLLDRSRQANLPPLLSSAHDWLLVLAWLAVLFYLYLATSDRKLAVGLFLLPVVLVLVLSTYFVSSEPNTLLDAQYGWKMFHATLLVLGMGGVVVGFVLGLMYLVQHRRLKHRHGTVGELELPNLEKLAKLNRWAVMLSVPLLTLGLATGVGLALYSKSSATPVSFRDPVVIANIAVWLAMVAFFVLLLSSKRPGPRQVAWLTIWGFGFLLVTMVGLQVLTTGGAFSLNSFHTPGTVLSPPAAGE